MALITLCLVAGCGGEVSPAGSDAPSAFTIDSLPSDSKWSTTLGVDSVVGGRDIGGTPLYICRARYGNSIQPGKLRADWNQCHFSYGGTEQWTSDFQVLTARWEDASNGTIPSDAFNPDIWASGSQHVYPCRANVGGSLQLGKIEWGFGACYIPYGNQELHVTNYQVLANSIPLVKVPAYNGKLPIMALPAGRDDDGATLYPCIAYYKDGTYTGKTRADWNACDISWGGSENFVTDYQALVPMLLAAPLDIVHVPFPAGIDTDGSSLGVCSIERSSAPDGTFIYPATFQLGKVLKDGSCAYPYGNKEVIATTGFSILPTDCGLIGGNCCANNICQGGGTVCGTNNVCRVAGEGDACTDVGGGHKSCPPGLNCNTLTDKCEGARDCNQVGHICCNNGCPSGSMCTHVDPDYSPGYCAPTGPACGTAGNSCCNGECSNGLTCVGGKCAACGLPGQACCKAALPCHENGSVCLPTSPTPTCSQNCGYSGASCCNVGGKLYCAGGPNDCDSATNTCL